MIQQIRDKVLASLMDHFDGAQLAMIDKAVADALHGYRVEVQETLPDVVSNEMLPEIAEYLGRKKSKGCAKGTLEQYKYVLKTFALYSRKKLQEWNQLAFITLNINIPEHASGLFSYPEGGNSMDIRSPCKSTFFRRLTSAHKGEASWNY